MKLYYLCLKISVIEARPASSSISTISLIFINKVGRAGILGSKSSSNICPK